MRRDGGFVSIEWVAGLGIIVLPLVVVVTSVVPLLERTSMAKLMAQEAARTIVLSSDWETGRLEATRVAGAIGISYGFVGLCASSGCVSLKVESDHALERGAVVTVVVETPMAAVSIPFLGEVGAFRWRAKHSERVDDYRSFP